MMGANSEDDDNRSYLDLTSPYFEFPMILLNRRGGVKPLTLETLAGKRVAVTRGYPEDSYIRSNHPNIEVVPVANVPTGLRLTASGEVDAMAAFMPTASYYLQQEGITNLVIAGDFAHPLAVPSPYARISSTSDQYSAKVLRASPRRSASRSPAAGSRLIMKPQRVDRACSEAGTNPTQNSYLNSLTELTYCVDPDWMPFERINRQGRHEG
ncbi:transporter substrate-binding domain-containing protein [Candidatus Reidiella endopervernicosa]|uniref:Transporter substrate-binding domain-containing protein n=1 Tax=Candidatus Reidiella endopervernicosa TaxID=2738883 RepID=A0A6N0HYB8_9GAMM|nr:transporter substrate-binding domain-containing protein [Candidatus Reidiella endopervernicosa]QKQ27360.1 transporter substrate-binding domain-containing protein [Candidatus Reidiella endopervernicosa]